MTVELIATDWCDYDHCKKQLKADVLRFDFRAAWEVSYFSNKLKSIYPFIPDVVIKNSIDACAGGLAAPCDREEFVEQVLRRLHIPL